ncbi:SMP-30/gluconolactonase/LRE family protein [bacterium]|nr:SMP-30/gluconolactonase/LRE family protein [bacterium]
MKTSLIRLSITCLLASHWCSPQLWSQDETSAGAGANLVPAAHPSIGEVVRLDERINQLIPLDASIELLAEGFEWAEGPVWDRKNKAILFSDIPNNVVNQWNDEEGLSVFLKPSGYTGTNPRLGESGSNGLASHTILVASKNPRSFATVPSSKISKATQ